MDSGETWMGQPIDDMTREELAGALKAAARLLRSTTGRPWGHPDLKVRATPRETTVGRTFNWAFIPAGHLWSEDDRAAIQSRLDDFAVRHGLQGAVVKLDEDRVDVEVPRRLQPEQILALQEWLAAEKETLDVSQVP
jgi:hypothetical protein